MKTLNFLITFVCVICSCNNDVTRSDYFDKICITNKGFKVDTTNNSWSYSTIINNNFLNIRPISEPSDTFFLRIESTIDTTLQIFEYTFSKSKPTYKIYKFKVDYKSGKILFNKDHDNIKDFEIVFNPLVKGKNFIKQLEINSILDLPDSRNIQNYQFTEYANFFLIEYSNKCRYNILNYNNPYENCRKFKEAEFLVNFLDYLKQEFNFLK